MPVPVEPVPSGEPPITSGWYWAVPRIAIVLVFATVAALLWLLHRTEIDEHRVTLITDVLWVEQDLRFHLTKVQDLLDELGRDAADGRMDAGQMEQRSRFLMTNNPWLIQIIWYDGEPQVVAAVPPGIGEYAVGEAAGTIPSLETFGFARSLGKAVFGQPYPAVNRDHHVEVHVPQFRDGRLAHMMVGVVSLNALLHHAVPWWYAEKYRLQVIDDTGAVLASKSKVAADATGLSYAVPFDPPGRGLLLQALAYKAQTNLLRNLLATVIVGLALAVLGSLWALRRHVQRRLAAEAALRDQHAFRKAMEDSLTTGLRARDMNGRITYVNPAFCRMVGWSAEELVGRGPPMPYWAPEDIEQTQELHDSILAGKTPHEAELRFMRRNGERFDALIYEAPLIDAMGRQSGWMASVVDITARKRAEELARQQQEKLQFTSRLVTMGEMASTLAHELNQPLSAIASYNTGCLNKIESNDFAREELAQVLRKVGQQAQRAGAIIRRVHEFVRRSEPKLSACELRAIVEDSVALVEAEAKKRGVRISATLPLDPMPVLADRVMIEQVLLNLIRNGMDALGDAAPEDKLLHVSVSHDGNTFVTAVADRGCGISAAVAERLFSPFFTTKVEGMGMGLNICRSIMELHQGRLWYEANPDGGTIFKFSLPEADA